MTFYCDTPNTLTLHIKQEEVTKIYGGIAIIEFDVLQDNLYFKCVAPTYYSSIIENKDFLMQAKLESVAFGSDRNRLRAIKIEPLNNNSEFILEGYL